jgi:cobalt-zinc-cadmium resistance protein CzcA
MYLPGGIIETDPTEWKLYQIHSDKFPDERFEPVKHHALDEAQLKEAESVVKLEKSKRYPAVHAGYINQHIDGMNNFHGWMAGLSVPLWTQPQRARIKQAEIDVKMKANETEYGQFANMQHVETLQSLLNEYFVQVSFCRENLLVEANLLLKDVEKDFSSGRITNYSEMLTKVSHAVSSKLKYLEYINMYNQTALELEYYTQ